MKDELFNKLTLELFDNWSKDNGFLGVTREQLRGYLSCKTYLKNKVFARLRKEKQIYLERRRYFHIK